MPLSTKKGTQHHCYHWVSHFGQDCRSSQLTASSEVPQFPVEVPQFRCPVSRCFQDDISDAVQKKLSTEMAAFGFAINKALVTEVSPNAEAPKQYRWRPNHGEMAMMRDGKNGKNTELC